MLVIPVIDLLDGQVVRGMAGRRSEYRPVVSRLTADVSPGGVARAFVEQLGASEVYVADLDAIAGREPNRAAYDQIVAAGTEIWLDAGFAAPLALQQAAMARPGGKPLRRLVLGLESLPSAAVLKAMLQTCDASRCILSLDLKNGQPLAGPGWNGTSPLEIAALAVAAGIERMIVLDLASVGMQGGVPTRELVRQIALGHRGLELVAGGGVRGLDDLADLARCGASAALVASALHDGMLTRPDLEAAASFA